MQAAIVTVDNKEKGIIKVYTDRRINRRYLSSFIDKDPDQTPETNYREKNSIYVPINTLYGEITLLNTAHLEGSRYRIICLKKEKEMQFMNGNHIGTFEGNTSVSFALDITLYGGTYKVYDSCLIKDNEEVIVLLPYFMILKEDANV